MRRPRQKPREVLHPEVSLYIPAGTPPTKAQLRCRALALRDAVSYADVLSASVSVREHLRSWAVFRDAECVCSYISVRSEMSTAGIILRALENGKKVIVPKVFGETLRFFRIRNLTDDLARGTFGVLEPIDGCEEADPETAGVCLVPGVIFDERGNRIGYGKGFYDRFLNGLNPAVPTIGLAYDCQVLKSVPAEDGDVPVQFLVTPSRGIFPTK